MKKINFMSLLLLVSSFLFAENFATSKVGNITSVQWLKENIQNPNLVLIDLRSEELYKQGHIKTAVNIPAMKNLYDNKFFMPKLDALKDLFSDAGIDSNSIVVAYGDGKFIRSARLYWILEVLGHHEVSILEVGYNNWNKNDFIIEKKEHKVARKNFIPRVDNTKVQTKLSTMMAIGKKVIIDGRELTHYQGEESSAKRFGHIPTAKNYACTNNYEVNKFGSKMKKNKDLEKLYTKLDKNKEIILYCTGGSASALNYVVLKSLGYKVSIYDGSWKEWGNDDNVPIVNPSLVK